jgi:Mrp family chromosome partitioning ATPase
MKQANNIQAISRRKRLESQPIGKTHSEELIRNDRQIVTVGNVKGGVGETTLAVNLTICEALRGQDILLVDGDEQGTARAFTQLRSEELDKPGYTAVSLHGAEIRTQVRQLRSKYQRIVIDVAAVTRRACVPRSLFRTLLSFPSFQPPLTFGRLTRCRSSFKRRGRLIPNSAQS